MRIRRRPYLRTNPIHHDLLIQLHMFYILIPQVFVTMLRLCIHPLSNSPFDGIEREPCNTAFIQQERA
jgi:hypothetical protein